MNDYPGYIIPTTATFCARSSARGGHVEVRPALPGTDLCGPCHARFPRILADLVGMWKPLHASRVRTPVTDYARDRVQSSDRPDPGRLWCPAAQASIIAIRDWTDYLVRILWREHPGTPVVNPETPTDVTLAALVTWYSRWMSHFPGLGAFWLDDALRLRARAMVALDSPGFKRVELRNAFCQDTLQETDYGPIVCLGPLVGILRPGDFEKPSHILCSVNPDHTRLYAKDWILAGE